MKKNLTRKSYRILHFLFGLLIIVAGIRLHNWFGALGLIPLSSGLFGYCPFWPGDDSACSAPKETSGHKHGEGCCH